MNVKDQKTILPPVQFSELKPYLLQEMRRVGICNRWREGIEKSTSIPDMCRGLKYQYEDAIQSQVEAEVSNAEDKIKHWRNEAHYAQKELERIENIIPENYNPARLDINSYFGQEALKLAYTIATRVSYIELQNLVDQLEGISPVSKQANQLSLKVV